MFFDGNINFCITNTVLNCKTYKCYNAIKAYRNTSLHIIGGYYTGIGATLGIGIDSGDVGDTLEVLGTHIDGFGVGIRNNILGSSITGRLEGNGVGVQVGALSDKCKIFGCHFDSRNSGAGVTNIEIEVGARRTQLALNDIAKITGQFRVSYLGSFTTILDEIPFQYDSETAIISMTANTSFGTPFRLEANECEQHYISTATNGNQWRMRSRSTGIFDVYNYTDGKVALSFDENGFPIAPAFTVATMPAGTGGGFIYVTDETGGATLAFYNGTNWLRIRDNVIVS